MRTFSDRHPLPTALALLATLALAAACSRPSGTVSFDGGYGLVIDASSSASTLHIYEWTQESAEGRSLRLPSIVGLETDGRSTDCEPAEPGLSQYAGRPDDTAGSLEPLVRCALERIGNDPRDLQRTSLHLRATAGLRLLAAEDQEAILTSVRSYLATTPFGSTSARIISGEEEGVYGWLSVNYLLGHLEHGGAFPTVGALDLGGASTQITFVPLDRPRADGQAISLAGNTYHVYTHSYLGLGQDQARQAVSSPACFLKGYPIPAGGVGTGDYDGCRDAIRDTLARPCDDEPCSLFGVFQPPVYGDFLALSVYAYTSRFFGLEGRLSPSELESLARPFCAQSWNRLVADDPSVADNPYLPNYCFSAAFVVTLMTDGFGLPFTTERVHAPIKVQGTPVGWALGALLYELAGGAD